ncbi:TPA: hypothetical protein DDW69_01535 [candidate division CPR2 bacterium]|uniref:Uncharacterized protein n=1 Tax=candidate division CPR2 bacterium GW2011_GWC1_41_48 TaxID=1618344 RepID=A0A0G0W9S2_UNCC2|nr:MAG: hypothetical protein UT47_C0001G0110 [candidate division CPR2 bacterium GW2011_GWC2_39_35]KKR27374.1 MAG: hypothetical protein UT60_C0051G0003 [candidate division CPR2 bacterium GW2011_GWD2_39_7]KKR28721.1 MAG: hypothetical protein UT59_C0020G0002 [candidate division CPR2 bacterium GW2011_GWD1_39_7]KKS09705.1 MAG: hypothetical protein UU65_C0001G0110 [candidate division CPR2 bacterium GW2011_GWC1_41_48]OGB61370.1 MAG: hypothetical protein A2Y27_01965 [candidate division CPR2 bacterium G
MWYLISTIILILVATIQNSLFESFKHIGLIPNFALVIFIYLLVYEDFKKAFPLSLVLGIAMDIMSTGIFGFYIVFFILLSLTIDFIKHNIGRSKSLSLVIIITAISSFTLIFFELLSVILTLKGIGLTSIVTIMKQLSVGALASIVASIIVKPLFQAIYSFSERNKGMVHYE